MMWISAKRYGRFQILFVALMVASPLWAAEGAGKKKTLRIIAFGAHPDDCEINAAGVAAMWAARGHKVKFVAVTNGDIGHYKMAGGPLALRRTAEVKQCAKILGIETEVLDNHDGELMPTLENRKKISRLIRQWQADIVLTHRPNDYHPDHRYTGILVQDAAFMVTVPFFTPNTPRVEKNPVFMYFPDNFQKPAPFAPDIVVGIDEAADKKWEAMAALRSQFSDWNAWHAGILDQVPKDEPGRKAWVAKRFQAYSGGIAKKYGDVLTEWYGKQKSDKIKYAEAFELCEYGRQPTKEELKALFPFFGE